MVVSMTGFGRERVIHGQRQLMVEVKSVNHRFLDLSVRINPRDLGFLEETVRDIVKKRLSRGRVEVFATYVNHEEDSVSISLNPAVVHAYQQAIVELNNQYGLSGSLDAKDVLRLPESVSLDKAQEDEAILQQMMADGLNGSLTKLIAMRQVEGTRLVEDLLHRADIIDGYVQDIEVRSPLVVTEYRDKLRKRISELLDGAGLEENRFNTEVAYFADRCSITEELVRLKSHVHQMSNVLKKEGEAGRKLDFLVQEMNREANTIGSKSSDIGITNIVVELKSEIEKIREQVQNIE